MPDRARFSCAAHLATLGDETKAHAVERLALLKRTLHERYALELRDDSRLAFKFATEETSWSLRDVADELAFIQFLSANSDYQATCERFLRILADNMHAEYGVHWNVVWRIVRQYGPDILKHEYISQMGCVPQLTVTPPTPEDALFLGAHAAAQLA